MRNERIRLPDQIEVARVFLVLANKVCPPGLPSDFAGLKKLPQKQLESFSSLSLGSLALGLLQDVVIFVEFANDLFEGLQSF